MAAKTGSWLWWLVGVVVAALLVVSTGCTPDETTTVRTPDETTTVRLHAQFARMCPDDWTDQPAPFGDGRIGVNTVFRAQPAGSTRSIFPGGPTVDRNILEMYFFDVNTEAVNAPPIPGGTGHVWVVETHDTDDRYRYQAEGVRVCWQTLSMP